MIARRQAGFTLLEILVALFIIGIISVMMVRGLQIVVTSKNELQSNETRLQRLDLAMSLVSGDMRNLINRSVVLATGQLQPPLMLHDDATQTLEFTRGGIANPLAEPRSSLQHAAYQLNNGVLSRVTWPVLDQVAASQPSQRILLQDVTFLQWQFLGSDNRFYTAWPATDAAGQPLPKAVKLTITIAKFGTLTRLFVVANGVILPLPPNRT